MKNPKSLYSAQDDDPASSDESESEAASSAEDTDEEQVPEVAGNDVSGKATPKRRKNQFDVDLLTAIIDDQKFNDQRPFDQVLKECDWSQFATEDVPEESVKSMLIATKRMVVKSMTVRDVLSLALTRNLLTGKNKRKPSSVRKSSTYQMFLRDYHKQNGDMAVVDRFRNAAAAFKSLPQAKLDQFAEEANQANSSALLNGSGPSNGTVVTTPKPKALFKDSDVEETPKKTPVPAAAKGKAKKEKEEDPTKIQINSFEYFAEERKKKHGKEKEEVVKKAFAGLSKPDKVQLLYRILQTIEKKYGNKRPVLSKSDQELLNDYEKKPTMVGSAYTFFLQDEYENHKEQFEGIPLRERMAKVGALWKTLPADEKARYEKKCAAKKAEYDEQYKEFIDNLPEFRRAQVTAPKARKQRQRRASVGDGEEDQTDSVFAEGGKKSAPAKRRVRSKTIDCSSRESMNIQDYLITNLQVDSPAKAKKRKPEEEKEEESPEEVPKPTPKKAKKNKKGQDSSPAPPPPRPPTPPVTKSPKKDKKAAKQQKKKVEEPMKPPTSLKEYFKTVYQGEPDTAKKAFKKLSLEQKQVYHAELKAISEQYLNDLNTYMQSLSKEQLAEYAARNAED